MHISQTWNIDQTRLLTRRELASVLADLKRQRSANVQRNLVIVRIRTNSPQSYSSAVDGGIHIG